jgi:hypothetical protein
VSDSSRNHNSENRVAKRARFASKSEKPGGASPLVLIAGIVVVVAAIAGTAFALTRPSPEVAASQSAPSVVAPSSTGSGNKGRPVVAATIGHQPYQLVVAENDSVTLPIASFDDHRAHYYTYMHEGQPIEFFVLESNDGVVRAAFNACDVCFGAKKGYTQDGDYMVCNNCGRRFPSDQINVLQGGCNPSPLQRAVEGEDLVIQADDLVSGLGYF